MMAELYIYFAVAVAGLVSFLSPCVLPLVPPYLGYLGGTTVSQASVVDGMDNTVWRRVVLGAVVFVLGFTTVFVALGASASLIGQVLRIYQRELSIVAGLVILLFGLHFVGVLRVSLFYQEARYHGEIGGQNLLGAYLIGLAFAFGWTPCIGPVLGAVLTLAAREGSLAAGVSLLFVYSLGLGIPFVLAAIAVRPFLSFMQKFKRYLGTVETVMGIMLIVTGLLFAGEALGWVRDSLLSVWPGLDRYRFWIGLVLLIAAIWWIIMRVDIKTRTAGVMAMVLAMMLIGGSITWIGQFMIKTFPALAEIEQNTMPKSLEHDILKRSK